MVTILPPVEKKPSFGERLNQGVGRGLEMGSQLYQQHQQKEAQKQAFESLGINPLVANLPEEAQAAYFKQVFSPEKQMTPLQQSQQRLAEERLKTLQGQQKLSSRIFGESPEESSQMNETSQQKNPLDLSSIPEEKLRQGAAFSGQQGEMGTLGNMFKGELDKRQKEEEKKRSTFIEERKYHTELGKKAREEAEGLRSSLPRLEMSLNFAREAVESGEVGAFSLANLGQRLGIRELQTAKGAQLVTAAKENLLGNMSRVSARAQNQWFEQRLNSMMAQVGQSEEANLTAQEMLESEVALSQAYLNEYDRLAEEDEKNYGFERKDLSKRAHAAVKPLENHIFSRSNYRLKEIEENEKGLSKMKSELGKNVPKGTPLTMAMAKLYKDKFGENALKMAEKNGYRVPTLDEWTSYQQRPQEFREGL